MAGEESEPSSKTKKLIIPVVLVLAIAALGVGGFFGYRYVMQLIGPADVITDDVMEQEKTADNAENTDNMEVVNDVPDLPPVIPPPVDTQEPAIIPEPNESGTDRDKDGLMDSEEITLGTDINNVDTDADGLFDREEVKVYKTNPLVQDTDGDGYLDGEEVSGGYNPNGPGRLYEIK